VLLIIDALMFEFADFNPENKQPLAYQNKMPVFRDLLKAKPDNARLFKFIADPPTTTMQRLKGLTTGSLPTFIDAGSNFASSEIDEDNFLDQIIRFVNILLAEFKLNSIFV
jgi:GPI ethanolamine phosphate transferase 3 subunit O